MGPETISFEETRTAMIDRWEYTEEVQSWGPEVQHVQILDDASLGRWLTLL